MPWTPKPKEVEAMLVADGKHRYEYFIHRVCDTRNIWGLYNEGWASLGDGERKLIPFWPHQTYAELFKQGDWTGYTPRAIDLSVFLERWIPGMRADGVQPAIFPVGTGNCVTVTLTDLEANLRHELAESYGEEG